MHAGALPLVSSPSVANRCWGCGPVRWWEDVWAAGAGAGQRLLATPGSDSGVVAAEEHVRHAPSAKLGRARIVGVLQHTGAERFFLERLGAAQHAGEQSRDRVEHHQRRKLPATEHVIADGDFLIHGVLTYPLVNPLVMAADQDEVRTPGQDRRRAAGATAFLAA